MYKKVTVLILSILIIHLVFSGCINNPNDKNNCHQKESNYCRYNIVIEPSSNGNFYIYLPLLLEDSNTPSELNNIMEIKEGHGSFEMISNKYGMCFNISSSEKIVLNINLLTEDDILNVSLSMNIVEDVHFVKYHTYTAKYESIDRIDLSIDFDYKPCKGAPREKQEIQSTITNNGWLTIDGYREKITP